MAEKEEEYFDSNARKNNVRYNKFVVSKELVKSPSTNMVRAKFYRIRKYQDVDGTEHTYSDILAPIIFTLYVSKKKDIVHAVKVSEIKPEMIKKFFSKFVNSKTDLIEVKGDSRTVYSKKVVHTPVIMKNGYRTYKLSGIKQIFELDMDETQLTPINKQAVGVNEKSNVKNK
jgi:hypothetical protein